MLKKIKTKNSSYDFGENKVLFVKNGASVLDLQLDTFPDTKWCKCTLQTPDPKIMECSKISQFYWIHLMILEKTRPCFWTLEPGSRTYGKICLLHPSGPNEVCRPWTPKSSIFYIFHDFTGFFLWFLRKEGPVCEDSSQGSRSMARHTFWF